MSEVVDLLRALIGNACVNDGTASSGEEKRSVAVLQDFFGRQGEVFEPLPGRQSLIYRVAGADPSYPSIAFAPHLDVVPADPDGWSVDPFGAEVIDGVVWGRGAVDMLNLTSSMAYAVRPYVTGDKVPAGDLIFCALADEEAGGRFGAYPLTQDRWDLVGADFLLTEVAYPGLPAGDHRRVPVSVGEKGAFWTELHTSGTPGHGSAPFGSDNAISKLVQALATLGTTASPADIGETWADFARSIGIGYDTVTRLLNVDSLDQAIEEFASVDPDLARYLHAATHLTISPNIISGGTKSNVIADRASAMLDIRALPGMDRVFVDSHLRKAMGIAGEQVDMRPVMDFESTASQTHTKLWSAIEAAVEEVDGHRDLVATTMTVATDARFWRSKGTVAYGVGLFDDDTTFSEMLSLFHGHNERVSADSVERTTTLYQQVLEAFMAES